VAIEAPKPWFPLPAPVSPETEAARRGERIPTGVPDFDHMTGGLPSGSVVLLTGEPGAGHPEFALTSAVHLMLRYEDPELHRYYLGGTSGKFVYPSNVAYLSLSRSREQVLREVEGSFEPTYHRVLISHLRFHDLSPAYFGDSVVPASWAALSSGLLAGSTGEPADPTTPLKAIAAALESDGPSNLVLLDSLTDLVVRKGTDPDDLAMLVKGLRRRAKEWRGIVYLLLTKGVAAPTLEQTLYDSVDGVLSFSWTAGVNRSHRQRQMVIERFMPVLAHVPYEHQGRFVIRVSALNGLVTTQYERV